MKKQRLLKIAILSLLIVCSFSIISFGADDGHNFFYKAELVKINKHPHIEETGTGAIKEYTTTVRLLEGKDKGKKIKSLLILQDYPNYKLHYKEGDKVIVSTHDGKNYSVVDHYRVGWLIGIIAIFIVGILLIGKKAGFKSLLSMFISILTFFILIILLTKGWKPIQTTLWLSMLNIIITILIVAGFSEKAKASILGTIFGISAAFIIANIVSKLSHITGLSDEQAKYLVMTTNTNFNPIDLFYCGVILGALGAVMDIAISLASSIMEVHKANPELTIEELYHSGMQIGKDILGTMTNTLVLAYLSSSIPMFILIYMNKDQLPIFYNMDFIALEVIKTFAGSLGLLAVIPFTCIITANLAHKKVALKEN